jgi:hypothetical protein
VKKKKREDREAGGVSGEEEGEESDGTPRDEEE